MSSFKTVNIHTHHRVSFEEWVERIGAHLKTGENNYYRTHADSYHDACPSVWKRMDMEDRQAVILLLDSFIAGSPAGTSRTKDIVAGLSRYCPLCDFPKLRICHIFQRITSR